jgi:acyl-coenzyme A synthetase/AMP-(fatty) acid ligase
VLTYKTGDWAVRIDGQLYFRKRIDNQVKVRGNRVELGGIDVALNKLGYKNVCTVHIDSDICSFIETSEKIHYSELRSILKSQLPEYEVPTFIQTVDCFPRSVNDKINVKELIKYCHILNKKKRGHA